MWCRLTVRDRRVPVSSPPQTAGASVAARDAVAAEAAALHASVAALSAQLEAAKTESAAARAEREAAISTSKPFAQMKLLLQRKNAAIVELRCRLERCVGREGTGVAAAAHEHAPPPDSRPVNYAAPRASRFEPKPDSGDEA